MVAKKISKQYVQWYPLFGSNSHKYRKPLLHRVLSSRFTHCPARFTLIDENTNVDCFTLNGRVDVLYIKWTKFITREEHNPLLIK